MSGFSVRRDGDRFNAPPSRVWCTTATVARMLGVATRTVLRFATGGVLAGERTVTGQWLFRRSEVQRLELHRADQRARSRAARLRAVRVRMLKVPPWRRGMGRARRPRQLAFAFPPPLPVLRIVARGGERACPESDTKRAESFGELGGSVKGRYVDQKSAVRRHG